MKLERIWRNRLLSLYYYVRERLSPSRLQDVHDIPIIINNFNRLTTLKELIAALCQRGYRHIYILDNASTYPPLLDYYATCPFEVIRLDANLGFKALWKSGMYKRFCHDYYVHDMPMSSTYVLLRVLPYFQRCNPCIFVMCVVTSTSLQSEALGNSVFRDLAFPLSP